MGSPFFVQLLLRHRPNRLSKWAHRRVLLFACSTVHVSLTGPPGATTSKSTDTADHRIQRYEFLMLSNWLPALGERGSLNSFFP